MNDRPIRRELTMRDLLIQMADLMSGLDPLPLGELLSAPVTISLPEGKRATVESACVEEGFGIEDDDQNDDCLPEDTLWHLHIHPWLI